MAQRPGPPAVRRDKAANAFAVRPFPLLASQRCANPFTPSRTAPRISRGYRRFAKAIRSRVVNHQDPRRADRRRSESLSQFRPGATRRASANKGPDVAEQQPIKRDAGLPGEFQDSAAFLPTRQGFAAQLELIAVGYPPGRQRSDRLLNALPHFNPGGG